MRTRTVALSSLVFCALLAAPVLTAVKGKPSKPAAKPDGPALFMQHCARCHGPNGEGKDGPQLRGLKHTLAEVEENVRIGIPNEMPAFGKMLTPEQLIAVSRHAHGLQGPSAR